MCSIHSIKRIYPIPKKKIFCSNKYNKNIYYRTSEIWEVFYTFVTGSPFYTLWYMLFFFNKCVFYSFYTNCMCSSRKYSSWELGRFSVDGGLNCYKFRRCRFVLWKANKTITFGVSLGSAVGRELAGTRSWKLVGGWCLIADQLARGCLSKLLDKSHLGRFLSGGHSGEWLTIR